jgi:hypothetical protein
MELRKYQKEISTAACELLNTYKIAYLSMQVRTGKTLTALETAKKYGAKKVLFVTKKKAMPSIESDYLGSYFNDYQIWVINYESLHKLGNDGFDLAIIDEAHSLGQYPDAAERTKQLKHICRELPIIYLSGTPSPESYSQLYHQFYISSFSPFTEINFHKWARAGWVNITQKYLYNRQMNDYSHANHEAIEERTKHLFIPYTQEEAGFEQLVNEHIHYVNMTDKLYVVANKLRKDRVVKGKSGNVILADTEVKLMQKLHQLYSGTVIFDELVDDNNDSAIIDTTKIDYILDKFDGKKIAIFYKFRAEAMAIKVAASNKGIIITESPEYFQSNDNCIFISQFVSGREGINLSSADCLICYNIDFSAITYFQVRARLQSKDRTDPADVHWIFAENGIEQNIYERVKNKQDYTLSYFKKDENKIKL